MKTLASVIPAVLFACTACQNTGSENSSELENLSKEAIAIHDTIMPQISKFDKTTVKIDSIIGNLDSIYTLDNSIDTAATKENLTTLKANLEAATDDMMDWMRSYSHDSSDVAYQKEEVARITKMKDQFSELNREIDAKMKGL